MKIKYILTVFLLAFSLIAQARYRSNTPFDEKKYRGNGDMGFSVGLAGGKGLNRFGFSCTNGYQVVPTYLYLGGGVEVDYYSNGSSFSIPLFLDLRTNFDLNASPFIDVRIGGSPFVIKGLYFSPSAGVRIPIDRTDYGISIMLGYSLQTGKFSYYDYGESSVLTDKKKMSGLHLKVGFEW